MNELLALRHLGRVMSWSDDRAREEYQWLRVISRFKYDGYREFMAGARFLEHLIMWLNQFETREDREVAYEFLRTRLVYITTAEVNKLVELFYYDEVRPRLAQTTADRLGIEPHHVWAHAEGSQLFNTLQRRTLFMGLSDGARIDVLRYGAQGALSNEQLVGATQVDTDKWRDLLENLRADTQDKTCTFHTLYVVDDITASGTSLIRKPRGKQWKGKMPKLWKSIDGAKRELKESPFAENFVLRVHHHLATEQARAEIAKRHHQAKQELAPNWFERVEFSFGFPLPPELKLGAVRDASFLQLADAHYDPNIAIEPMRHLQASGIKDLKRGYGACALPLVLEHNTPNNTIPILWEESTGLGAHAMRPLFRRRQRHT